MKALGIHLSGIPYIKQNTKWLLNNSDYDPQNSKIKQISKLGATYTKYKYVKYLW
jgi:hypothetical protein